MGSNSFEAENLRVVDGDDIVWRNTRYRLAGYDTPEIKNFRSKKDKALEWRRGQQARLRLETLIAGARSVHLIEWGTVVFPNRQLATLLIDGWDVATIATDEGWAADYKDRKQIDWGDRRRKFPDLPVPAGVDE